MCGIVGQFGFQDTALLKNMLSSIKHRGPDDEGTFSGESVALGIRRLAIVDIEHGNQPIHNEEKTLWIVFNGEIYNFPEIKEELTKLGHKFGTETDTETILHAYEQWDTDCVQKFNGMFAFAIWDKKKKRLFLARDRIGIKPLYYCGHSKRFLFASEIKALLVDPEVPKKPNDHTIYNFLATGHQSHTGDTFFANIKELPSAHYIIIDQNQLNVKRYWNLAVFEPTEPRSDEYYASKFRELLFDAIKIRLPENLAIGSFLSGGLDSTSIVCIAKILKLMHSSMNIDQEPQKLFSAYYHETTADERPYIEEVSRSVETKIDYVFPSSAISWNDIKAFVYYMDEPVTVLNYYAYWCLARITRGQVKITFSGQGPDEFLAGHADHFETYIKELWKRKRVKRLLIELIASLNRYGSVSVIRQAIAMLMLRGARVEELLDPHFVALHGKDQVQRKHDSLNTELLHDVMQNRLPMHLRVGDRVSSAFSTETRCPYLDYRIIEFSFSLAENQKIKNAWSKYVLRSAVKDIVPESVRRRRKFGTPIPLESWMKDFHEEINHVFNSNKFRDRGYFDQAVILDFYNRYCNGKLRRHERQLYGDMLWRILNLELWLEIFFDHEDTID
jgi:asparagine synthase (glutamine-hydrolysing)